MAKAAKKDDYQDQEALAFYLNTENSPEAVCLFLVERQHERSGHVGQPDDASNEILSLAGSDEEDGLDWFSLFEKVATDFHADAARRQPGVHAVEDDRWNDAELTGEDCPEWRALMDDTPIHPTFGKVFSKQKGRSTKDDAWNGQEMTWRAFIEGGVGENSRFPSKRINATGLSRHPENPEKEGFGFVFGNCDTYRRADSTSSIFAETLDVDDGSVTFDEGVTFGQDTGVAFIAATSHSHLTEKTMLRYDDVVKHAKCSGEPSLKQIKTYLREKKGLAPNIVDSVEVEEMCKETSDGWMIRLSHAPIHKFRFIVPLAEGEVSLRGLANTQAEAQAVYAAKVRGLSKMLGIPTDPATLDVSRSKHSFSY